MAHQEDKIARFWSQLTAQKQEKGIMHKSNKAQKHSACTPAEMSDMNSDILD